MNFAWFWTFWHWSKESLRCGTLLRGPLEGIAGHWDEWFRHEASATERQLIDEAGKSERTQRQFIAWLFRHWAHELNSRANRLVPRFVLGQLANLPPFNEWVALKKYRASYDVGGMSAIVLEEGSQGEPADVRRVEALVLPGSGFARGQRITAEGFEAESTELNTPRRAALSLLSGKALLPVLALWILRGRRPYPRWLGTLLALGWTGTAALMAYLLLGPDPGDQLFHLGATLAAAWSGLVLIALCTSARVSLRAWRRGKALGTLLEQSHLRLRMNGGLTVRGGSAGLPFCLNTLSSLHRAYPGATRGSWLWRRCLHGMVSSGSSWAATGVVTEDARLKPVLLAPKVRACLQATGINHLLAPRQREGSQGAVKLLGEALTSDNRAIAPRRPAVPRPRLGFAAEKQRFSIHRCRHTAQSLMVAGGLNSARQAVVNGLAVLVTSVLLAAGPDLRCILFPPPAPTAKAPSSPSPYHLWVSLDTNFPKYFTVLLESRFWSNRRADVALYAGANASVRAEIRLHRVGRQVTEDAEDGTVWVERRRRFLTREYAPGERVGRYSLSYLARLGHE